MMRDFQHVLLLLFLAGISNGVLAQNFSDKSLHGNYALIGTGGSHDAASIGTSVFDGKGNVSRSLVLNAPGSASAEISL